MNLKYWCNWEVPTVEVDEDAIGEVMQYKNGVWQISTLVGPLA